MNIYCFYFMLKRSKYTTIVSVVGANDNDELDVFGVDVVY